MTERPFAPPPPPSSPADALEARFARLQFKSARSKQPGTAAVSSSSAASASASTYSAAHADSGLADRVSRYDRKQHGSESNGTESSSSLSAVRPSPPKGPRAIPDTSQYQHSDTSSNHSLSATYSYSSHEKPVSRDSHDSTSLLLSSLPSAPSTLPSANRSSQPSIRKVSPPSDSTYSHHPSSAGLPSSSARGTSSSTSSASSSSTATAPAKKFDFPRAVSISPETLADYILKVPQQILLLDVRSREDFDEGHIYSRNVVNIDPIVLRPDQTSVDLEDALIVSPEDEQDLFSRRHEFELIVYYDQSSRSGNFVGNDPQTTALRNLFDTIYEKEPRKMLKRQPVLLVGGVDAWVAYCGRNSLVASKAVNGSRSQTARLSNGSSSDGSSASLRRSKQFNGARLSKSSLDFSEKKPDLSYEAAWLQKGAAAQSPSSVYASSTNSSNSTVNGQSSKNTTTAAAASHYSTSTLKYPSASDTRHLTELPTSSSHHSHHHLLPHHSHNSYDSSHSQPDVYARDMNDFFRRTAASAPVDLLPKRPTPVLDRPAYSGRISAHSIPTAGSVLPSINTSNGSGDLQQQPTALVRKPQPIDYASQLPSSPTMMRTERQPSFGNNFSGLGEVSAGMTGLKNLGNTCYMNSVIQCLAGTSLLARIFLNGTYRKQINMQNKLGTQGVLAKAFGDLVAALYSDQCTFLVPTTMKDVTGRLRPEFAGSDQQDAQEFLTFLLDSLHEDLNLNGGKTRLPPLTEQEERMREKFPVRYASFLEWERYRKSDNSAIVSMFQGQYQSKLMCMTCKFTSTTYNPFSVLSLPLAPGKHVSLKQCFDMFVMEEVLDKDDAWYCPQCKTQRKATKTLRIARLPMILIVHLKRFKTNGRWTNKLDTFVDYPVHDLDLTSYWPAFRSEDSMWIDKVPKSDQVPPFKYNLYGVVNHYGTLRGGHYTAYMHKNNKGWLVFDDSRVAMIKEDKVVSRDAYVLFYQRDTSML
ncbi:hypothetical protein BZA70DRAFT_295619 [Myxozyma melibiosi]|uniref:Ubiquitin carboxyl-terminal hydrolase n=1 Tax=Myxozyma melibiosi TaxID=54550 RepID=A0ABR1F7U2_9ASCO